MFLVWRRVLALLRAEVGEVNVRTQAWRAVQGATLGSPVVRNIQPNARGLIMRMSLLSRTLVMTLLLALVLVADPAGVWADDISAVFSAGSTTTACTVQLSSVSFDVENLTSIGSGSGGAGAGKAKLNPIKITKAVDPCSPHFFIAAVSGQHYESVQLVFRSKANSQPYFTLTLSLVFITKIAGSANTEEPFHETLELAYGALRMSAPASAEVCWDQVSNSDACP
jgi:type VI secretion system Hcp family effector